MTDTPTLVAPLRLFLLTFLFAVPFWILGFLVESPDAVPMAMPVSALMFVCPAIAATLLAWQEGRSAAVRALWGRLLVPPRPRRWVWYAAIPLVSAGPVLTHLLLRFAGEPVSMPQPTLPGVLALVCVYLGAAAAEEVGWTAYATDALRARHGALTTALVIGVVSAAWHVVPWSQVHPPARLGGLAVPRHGRPTRAMDVGLRQHGGKCRRGRGQPHADQPVGHAHPDISHGGGACDQRGAHRTRRGSRGRAVGSPHADPPPLEAAPAPA